MAPMITGKRSATPNPAASFCPIVISSPHLSRPGLTLPGSQKQPLVAQEAPAVEHDHSFLGHAEEKAAPDRRELFGRIEDLLSPYRLHLAHVIGEEAELLAILTEHQQAGEVGEPLR